jgi:hypothetical protein
MDSKLTGMTLGIAVLTFYASLASATTTEYTDVLSFEAAVLPPSTYNFEGIAPSGSVSFVDVTVGGATFTAGGGSNYDVVIDSNAGIGNYGSSFFSGEAGVPGVAPSEVVCTLAGAMALGFTYGDWADAAILFTVTLSTGDIFTLTTPSNAGFATGFVGFVSDTPITSVTFADNGSAFDVLQFSESAGATSVPEPGTLALTATGLLGMALLGRRRRMTVEAGRLDLRQR